jgi:hypothetical protein
VALRHGPAAIGLLKVWRLGPIEETMARMLVHRLQARVFILALALALVGQVFAPFTMVMPPVNASMVGMSLTPSGLCLDCKGMDHSKAIGSDCTVGVCSGIVAVMPAPVSLEALPLRSYWIVARDEVQGITIPPALGPPRALHFA